MRFRKTPTRERHDYVYRFNDGSTSVITGNEETEVLIKSLHAFDDAEVYNNIKNSRPQVQNWQKSAIEKWKHQHPYNEPEKNWNISMDRLRQTENLDVSIYSKQLAEIIVEQLDPQKEFLYEKLEELPKESQQLYRLYYIEGWSQQKIADKMSVSQNTVSKKIRKLEANLIKMCRTEI